MDEQDSHRSPRAWLLGVLALALILGSVLLAQPPDRAPAPAAPAGRVPTKHSPPAPTRPAPAAPAPAVPDKPVLRVAGAATAEGETCGFGRAAPAADDPYGLQHLPPVVRQRALDAVEGRLLASADPQVRAAAWLIGSRARGGSRARIEQLARLAAVSQDPIVYAIALEGCGDRTGQEAAACALLSRSQGVRLDADNAQPWLALAATAREQRDGDAEAEAMRRAARAMRSDAHDSLLPALVDRALGEQAPPLQRTLAVSASWTIQAAWPASHTSQAHAYCITDLSADADRRAVCHALAETLAYRGTSVADLGVGLAIGTALGWSAQRLAGLQLEHDALSEAAFTPLIGADLSCEGVEQLRAWSREVGRHGELQAMRKVLAESGRSIEAWSAQHQRNFALAAATVQMATEEAGR
ncbi:hypothetical protein [Piscinibacter sp. XHJ-5]|uniref:hypothetical protein n=1 Tax=Piscinibacter sp. XHJ-5 TaxID=3037797 RepID=UPI002453209A|nr:hypothetical protein [Piscinibacter sp. XHJ-5]